MKKNKGGTSTLLVSNNKTVKAKKTVKVNKVVKTKKRTKKVDANSFTGTITIYNGSTKEADVIIEHKGMVVAKANDIIVTITL